MKRCFKCGLDKPFGEFYVHREMLDGRLSKCRECTKRDVKAHRAANPERLARYERTRSKSPKRRALAKRIVKRWRAAKRKERESKAARG